MENWKDEDLGSGAANGWWCAPDLLLFFADQLLLSDVQLFSEAHAARLWGLAAFSLNPTEGISRPLFGLIPRSVGASQRSRFQQSSAAHHSYLPACESAGGERTITLGPLWDSTLRWGHLLPGGGQLGPPGGRTERRRVVGVIRPSPPYPRPPSWVQWPIPSQPVIVGPNPLRSSQVPLSGYPPEPPRTQRFHLGSAGPGLRIAVRS